MVINSTIISFVGGGVAFNYYTDADLYAAPIYANFRANFINKKVTPFADVKPDML